MLTVLPDVFYFKAEFEELVRSKCTIVELWSEKQQKHIEQCSVFPYDKAPEFIKRQNKRCDHSGELLLVGENIFCAYISKDPENIIKL